jgi:hypothetical protein
LVASREAMQLTRVPKCDRILYSSCISAKPMGKGKYM